MTARKPLKTFFCPCGVSVPMRIEEFPLHCVCGRTHQDFGEPCCRAGTELHDVLASFGMEIEAGCECRKHIRAMDRHGCDWCRDNVPTIEGWLREEAERRELPFSGFAARRLIHHAIRRAEKKFRKEQAALSAGTR